MILAGVKMASKSPQPRQPGKSGKPKAAAQPKPGDGLMGWLGRQVGHVKHAVQADVTKPAKPNKPGSHSRKAAPQPKSAKTTSRPGVARETSAEPDAPSIIVYRQDKIEEAEMPHQPGVKLRRTIIDEVIVEKKKGSG